MAQLSWGGRSAALVVPLCALALASSACLAWEPRNTEGVRIINGTGETVTVVVLYPSPAEEAGRVPRVLEKCLTA